MRFLADMGIALRIVQWLRAAKHDALHLRELSLGKLADQEIFDKAAVEQRIILTFDLDFGEILALSRADCECHSFPATEHNYTFCDLTAGPRTARCRYRP
jgi:predicted nuclease of predicted toxin-antitoxin system